MTLAVVVVCALRHALSSVLKDNGNEDVFLQMSMNLFECVNDFRIFSVVNNESFYPLFIVCIGSGLTPDQLCLLAQPNTDDFLLE